MKEYPYERYLRDARILSIFEVKPNCIYRTILLGLKYITVNPNVAIVPL